MVFCDVPGSAAHLFSKSAIFRKLEEGVGEGVRVVRIIENDPRCWIDQLGPSGCLGRDDREASSHRLQKNEGAGFVARGEDEEV
jgi:hypothetical protein